MRKHRLTPRRSAPVHQPSPEETPCCQADHVGGDQQRQLVVRVAENRLKRNDGQHLGGNLGKAHHQDRHHHRHRPQVATAPPLPRRQQQADCQKGAGSGGQNLVAVVPDEPERRPQRLREKRAPERDVEIVGDGPKVAVQRDLFDSRQLLREVRLALRRESVGQVVLADVRRVDFPFLQTSHQRVRYVSDVPVAAARQEGVGLARQDDDARKNLAERALQAAQELGQFRTDRVFRGSHLKPQ